MQHPVRVAIACATDLLVFGASAPAGAALIRNGSFDAFVPSNGTGGHWATSQVAANGGWRSTTSENSFENFFILNDNGPLESDPSMAQTITGLIVGERYTVSGVFESFRPSDGNPAAFSFGVEIVGVALRQYQRPPSLLGSFELQFFAASTTHILRLTAERNGDDSAYAVDDVSMVSAAGECPGPGRRAPAALSPLSSPAPSPPAPRAPRGGRAGGRGR